MTENQNEIPGVVQNSNSKNYYWSIFEGQLARKVDEGFAGAKMRTNKNNMKVWEQHVGALTGILRDVNVHENTFDGKKIKQLVIKLIPKEGFLHVINIPKESRYYGSFLEKLFNINIKQEVQIQPYSFEDEKTKKKQTGISVSQNGNKVASHYKHKEGDKWIMERGFPEFPSSWNSLTERDKKNYFFDVDEFFDKELARWRAQFAPDYQKEREQQFDKGNENIMADRDDDYSDLINTNKDENQDLPF